MASTLSLVKRATVLATAGLAELQEESDEPSAPCHRDDFVGYDDLVKAKGILDLLNELPSFQAELGRYSASLNLCGGILARSIQRKRAALGTPTILQSSETLTSSGCRSSDKVIEIGGACDGTRASTVPAPAPAAWGNTSPTSQGPPETLSFDSIVGNATAKRTLFEHVVLPLKLSEEARNSLFAGIRSSGSNVLLHGPPGTGKTSIAQAASQEAGAAFYSVTPSSILSKFQGESEKTLHQLFDEAKKNRPSIVFLDELDALAPSRDAQDDVQSRRLLAELLLQTSQLRSRDQVVVVAATNRIDDIDVALLRRFHSRIFVGPPSVKERADMMVSFVEGIDHSLTREQFAILADRTSGWSGSDIKSLCREACMGPVRCLYEQEGGLETVVAQQRSGEGVSILRPVHMSDCEKAYSFLMGSSTVPAYLEQVSVPMPNELMGDDLAVAVLGEGQQETRERQGFDHPPQEDDAELESQLEPQGGSGGGLESDIGLASGNPRGQQEIRRRSVLD